MRSDEEPSGAHKVAAFLLSLERAAAAAVMKRLDPEVVSEVAAAMSRIESSEIAPAAVDRLYAEIARTLHAPPKPERPKEKDLSLLLESAFGPERARNVLAALRERRKREHPFEFVGAHPPERLARALASESPAVAALVLAHAAPELSGTVLGALEPPFALEVVRRMANLVPPAFEVLAAVAAGLEKRLIEVAAVPLPPPEAERRRTIAEMLKYSQPEVEKSVLEGLENHDEELVAEIREFMFTWTDLAEVDKRTMQKILSSVDTRTLALSLKGCTAQVEQNLLQNLSSRVREMVAEERELAGAVTLAEVELARGEILKAVRALMESGDFRPARGNEQLLT